MSFSIVSSGLLCTYMHKKSDTVFCSFGYFLAKMGFPHSPFGKESACNSGDPGSIPGSGRSPGEGMGYLLQYSWASLVAQLVKNPPARICAYKEVIVPDCIFLPPLLQIN